MAETQDEPAAVKPPELPDGEYAIAEIMGHSTMVGRVTEVERFGTKMLHIEPIWQDRLLPAVYVGGASLYRFTPCTKEVAQKRQARQRYNLPAAVEATLPPETVPALAALGAEDGDPDFGEVGDPPEEEDELGDEF